MGLNFNVSLIINFDSLNEEIDKKLIILKSISSLKQQVDNQDTISKLEI